MDIEDIEDIVDNHYNNQCRPDTEVAGQLVAVQSLVLQVVGSQIMAVHLLERYLHLI